MSLFRRKNHFAVVTGANGVTYALGPMPRQRAEHETRAWRASIGMPAAAVKRTRHNRATLRRNRSEELVRLQGEAATP